MEVGKFSVPWNRSNGGTAVENEEALPAPVDEEEAALLLDEAQWAVEILEEHNYDIDIE